MTDTHMPIPDVGTLKNQAKRLRVELSQNGMSVTHSKSLELLAHQYGFKDWNGLSARASMKPAPNSIVRTLRVGQTVEGYYLGQKFVGDILGLQKLTGGHLYQLTLEMNEPVDVVSFESFSNLRKRIVCKIDEGGVSREKTSDGWPHMVLGGLR